MSALEQKYFNMLVRNDHPIFNKEFPDIDTFDIDTPFNYILNLLVAKELARFKADKDIVSLNSFPNTVTALTIDRWEEVYFGFTKTQVDFSQRVTELVARYNDDISMSVPDVIALAESIVGLTPVVIRNAFFSGWVLDDPGLSVLDISTVLPSDNQAADSQLYLVIFNEPVDSQLLAKLDEELTLIEKAGSRHEITAPPNFWVLNQNTLDIDTILG